MEPIDKDPVCVGENDALPEAVLLGHAVSDALAEGEILELEESVKKAEGLPDTELAPDELTVTV